MLFAAMTLVLVVRPRGLLGAQGTRMNADRLGTTQRRFLVEALTAAALIAAPFVLPYFGAAPDTVNRILVWGLFGIGFDILFGYTGLLSFGQSALYGTGGMRLRLPAHAGGVPLRRSRLLVGMASRCGGRLPGRADRAAPHRDLLRHDHGRDRGGVLLRRVQPAVALDRRRERAARGARALALPRLHHAAFQDRLVALSVSCVLLFRRHRDRAADRALAGRRDPARDPREPAARGGRRAQHPRLQAGRVRHRRGLRAASPAACSA